MFRLLRTALLVLRTEGVRSFFVRSRSTLRRRYERRQRRHRPPVLQAPRPLSVSAAAAPRVSIIIPAFNQSALTFNCLLSIAAHTSDVAFEVLVVDDASTDDTRDVLALVQGVRVIRLESNTGFVQACNAGASAARGELLMFLNNDTIVTPGWLSALVRVLDDRPNCGAVGSKLVYPNGRLQEAGVIVWRDGRAANYGRGDDAERPAYNFVREVDYGSAAALLVRRALFERVGGFDRRFAPGYWEDADLCFALRALGYAIVYQPASKVVHFEGQTAGRSSSGGMKQHQEEHQEVFRQKWSAALATQAPAGDFFAGRQRATGLSLLVLDHAVPAYDRDAGMWFTFALLDTLRTQGHRVVLWPHNLQSPEPYTSILQQRGIEVLCGDINPVKYLRREGGRFDAALIYRTHVAAAHLRDVRPWIPKVVFLACDMESLRERRRSTLMRDSPAEADALDRMERQLIAQADHVVVHSPVERELTEGQSTGTPVSVLPLPIQPAPMSASRYDQRRDLLFVGSKHPPNMDALEHYVRDIRPRLEALLPGLRLVVAGDAGPAMSLRDASLDVLGHVPTLDPLYEQARVFIAPLRFGAGIKGKILEALARGVPVITTAVGAEGIELAHETSAMIADDPMAFADAVRRVYTDPRIWERLRANGRQVAVSNHSLSTFAEAVDALLTTVLPARADRVGTTSERIGP